MGIMKRSQPTSSSSIKKPKSLAKDDPDYSSDESDLVDEKPAQSIDFSRIWLTVKQKPHDFTSWCTLLQLSEQDNKLGLIRKAFNEFFKHYPYTYAYWKKFADLERRHGHNYHARREERKKEREGKGENGGDGNDDDGDDDNEKEPN